MTVLQSALDTCERKRTYYTQQDAIEAVKFSFWCLDSIQKYYKCPVCGHYHLTTVTHEY